jgi:glycine cleavage system aminomethyltransferase T
MTLTRILVLAVVLAASRAHASSVTVVTTGDANLQGALAPSVESWLRGHGHTIGKSIVYGYVPAEHAGHETYEIETFGRRVPARRSAKAPYDPERRKILV